MCLIPVGLLFKATYSFERSSTFFPSKGEEGFFQPAATDNLLLSHCVIFHSFDVVHICAFACESVHICFSRSRVMSAPGLRCIYASLVVRGPVGHWQSSRGLRPNVRPPSLPLPDDFANGSDCLRQSFPRRASSSSSHHNNAFLPLMTHWAWLHNSRRHIASTRM